MRFGPFELDIGRRAVLRDGIRLKLQQQPFAVLELLVEQAPNVVPREDIRRRIWGDDVHVDVEQGIAFCIRQVRSVLNDNSTSPRYIETLPRQGFRFIGNIEASPNQQVQEPLGAREPASPVDVAATYDPAPQPQRRSKAYAWIAVGVITFALLVGTSTIVLLPSRHNELYTVAQLKAISTYPGMALHPCYSPDGRQVTFSLDEAGTRSIYIAAPGSDHPLRLTRSAFADDFPVWSPDAKYIAFLRLSQAHGGELMMIPALGGEERTLHSVDLSLEAMSASSYLAWTSDSKWICFTSRPEKSKSRVGLVLFSLESGESRPVFSTTDPNTSDSAPAFSPDGRWLAFAHFTAPYISTILLQRLSPGLQPEGDAIPVRGAGKNPISPAWSQDSRTLFFLDRLPSRLLQAEISDIKSLRPAHQIYASNAPLNGLSFAGPEPRLSTSTYSDGTDLWAISLLSNSDGGRVPRKILASKATQYHPEYSPDGRWLAFVSGRDGSWQVWVASSNGDHPRQVTRLANYILGYPSWSPDGQSIAFHARTPDEAELYVVDVVDGVRRQVTHGGPSIAAPSWSGNGTFLYGFGPHNGTEFVSRIAMTSGKREFLWEGMFPREVPGRHLLLYTKINQRGIFARQLTDRGSAESEQKLNDDLVFRGVSGFVPAPNGFFYAASDAAGRPRAICFYSLDRKKAVDLAPAPQNLSNGLAISPDHSTLIYATDRSDEAFLTSLELKRELR